MHRAGEIVIVPIAEPPTQVVQRGRRRVTNISRCNASNGVPRLRRIALKVREPLTGQRAIFLFEFDPKIASPGDVRSDQGAPGSGERVR